MWIDILAPTSFVLFWPAPSKGVDTLQRIWFDTHAVSVIEMDGDDWLAKIQQEYTQDFLDGY